MIVFVQDQDPGMWPEVARVTRETLHIRYTLLPFLYTLFHKTHTEGTPVIRPLFFEWVLIGLTMFSSSYILIFALLMLRTVNTTFVEAMD
jgi:Glycosyl hydrolases family 31